MPRSLLVLISVALLVLGCAGSTSFLGDNPSIQLIPGASDSVTLEFEAEGSHAGDYEFTATPSGEALSAEVEPTSASVDGVVELTVMITAAGDSEPGFGSVMVEGTDGSNAAGIAISVEVLETNPATNNTNGG